jgi:glycosyltransferase involved in cell wall biosynthesis
LLYTRFFEFPVSRVIDVLLRVREQIPNARLLVVGKGLFGEEEGLFRLAKRAGLTVQDMSASPSPCLPVSLSSEITYLGFVPAENLPAAFTQATIAIYPFDDTLVNRTKCAVKLCDLLAAGVPVVAEAVGQNREYVRHGETGLLVEPGDVDGFAAAVVRLLEDAPLRERLGSAAARDLRERFAWERLVETVERAYGVG